jgi:hypothetical protein
MALSPHHAHWLLWAPLGATVAHIVEEFVWPGGFLRWYQRYRGPGVSRVTPGFLTIINLVLLAACAHAAFSVGEPFGVSYWITIAAILASNGLWHLWSAVKVRAYSPGMVTGLLLYVPLAVYGCTHFLWAGSVPLENAATALLIGGSYPWWSSLVHSHLQCA